MTRKRNVTTSMKATLWHLLDWVSINDLAAKRKVTRAPTARALARLHKLGLVQRMESAPTKDATYVYWRATTAGIAALQGEVEYVAPVVKEVDPEREGGPSYNPFNWRSYEQPFKPQARSY